MGVIVNTSGISTLVVVASTSRSSMAEESRGKINIASLEVSAT